MSVCTVGMATPENQVSGIQIWSKSVSAPPPASELQYVSRVYHARIPPFLVSQGPYDVYSELEATETFFYDRLACEAKDKAVLARCSSLPESYVVFFPADSGVRCFYIDLTMADRARIPLADNTYHPIKSATPKSDMSVFDRVLELKVRGPVPLVEKPQQSLLLQPQIHELVSKCISLGLRLRGLSLASASHNDRVALKEVYQMTRQAALFSLRKFTYGFNKNAAPVTVDAIQQIVESLLQTFVDLESTTFDSQ